MNDGNILTITTISRTNKAFLVDINLLLSEYNHFAAASDIVDSEIADVYKEVFNIPILRSPVAIFKMNSFKNILFEKIIKYKIDIVHVHTPVAAFMVRYVLRDQWIRRKLNIKIVYTAHGLHFFPGNALLKNLSYGMLEFIAGKWTDRLIIINKTDEQSAKKYKLIDEKRIIFMPGIGIDLKKNIPSSLTRLREGNPYFLVVAEFIPRKRHRDILRALSLTSPGFDLRLAGDGPLQEEMLELAAELNISDRVFFIGHRSDVPELMQESLALILASDQEGLPRSVLEAMALETLVIGSKIRGNVDLLEGESGVLFDVGKIEDLAKIMTEVFKNPAKYEDFKRNARIKVEEYRIENIANLHKKLYSDLMNEVSENRREN